SRTSAICNRCSTRSRRPLQPSGPSAKRKPNASASSPSPPPTVRCCSHVANKTVRSSRGSTARPASRPTPRTPLPSTSTSPPSRRCAWRSCSAKHWRSTMSDADLFYGPADAAPAPSTTQSTMSDADLFYGSTDAQAEPTNLYDGSVNNQLASSLAGLIEAGEIERSEAVTVGRTLTSEAQAVGLAGGDIDTVFRDLNQPIDPKTSQRDRAQAVASLREE